MEPLIKVDPLSGPTYENLRSGPRVLRPLDIDFADLTYTVHVGKGVSFYSLSVLICISQRSFVFILDFHWR